MSRLLSTAFAVLSLVSVAGLAHAQGPGGPGGGMRANLDTDGDGAISASEFDASAKLRFQRMDANQDGVIDAGELATLEQRRAERQARRPDGGGEAASRPKMLAGMDADNDGKITEAEALAVSKARFAKLDANGDGKLDETEQAAMRQGRPGGPQ